MPDAVWDILSITSKCTRHMGHFTSSGVCHVRSRLAAHHIRLQSYSCQKDCSAVATTTRGPKLGVLPLHRAAMTADCAIAEPASAALEVESTPDARLGLPLPATPRASSAGGGLLVTPPRGNADATAARRLRRRARSGFGSGGEVCWSRCTAETGAPNGPDFTSASCLFCSIWSLRIAACQGHVTA